MTADSEVCVLNGFLGPEALLAARKAMAGARFQDGVGTATDAAREVKRNRQVDPGDHRSIQVLQQLLLQGINGSQTFRERVVPKDLHDPRFALYEAGMAYGWHVDSPLMGHPPVRTDFALTVFLDDPATYEGGELEVQLPSGVVPIKLAAGDAVVYPCAFLHRVAPVSSGCRRVMVTWIQSLIPDPVHRSILASLQRVQARLEPNTPEALDLQQQIANLTRLWVRN